MAHIFSSQILVSIYSATSKDISQFQHNLRIIIFLIFTQNFKNQIMSKKIFLAGATGAIGQVLSRLLVADGWDVYGTTRSENKVALLQEMGVKPVVVDVYNAEQLKKSM
ncbi:MAG: NAD(P)H-binding protein, partial [Parachlamydiaceae bacterium]